MKLSELHKIVDSVLSEGDLQKWVNQDWVRIDSSGNIAGKCGTSKNKKNPDRCLPRKKAQSLSKSERKATAAKKKKAGSKGKQTVSNTKKAKVKKEHIQSIVREVFKEIKESNNIYNK